MMLKYVFRQQKLTQHLWKSGFVRKLHVAQLYILFTAGCISLLLSLSSVYT